MENKIPQLEQGFVRIANGIAKQLAKTYMSSYESQILWCLFVKTYGFNKKEDWISNSQFVEATGIYKSHISRTIKKLIQRKIVTQTGNKIAFQKDSRLWCELPKQVTVTQTGNAVTHLGQKVTQMGQKLPKQADTIDNIQKTLTKDTLQKTIISKDITKSSFGNQDINFLIRHLKEKLQLPILDETEKVNRRYCWLAMKKFGGVDKIKLLIEATAQNQFWSTKITSFKSLYYKGVNIISSNRDFKSSTLKL